MKPIDVLLHIVRGSGSIEPVIEESKKGGWSVTIPAMEDSPLTAKFNLAEQSELDRLVAEAKEQGVPLKWAS